MSRLPTLLRTAWALGVPSIARVVAYRLALRLGVHPVQRLAGEIPAGPFFLPPSAGLTPVAAPPVTAWQDEGLLFGRWPVKVGTTPPDWHSDPLSGRRVAGADRPWWQIPDFDGAAGDIKCIWELSRLDWVLAWAQRIRQGDGQALARLNSWLADWCRQNPPYRGPNWKCGQEASFRVLHLAMAALVLEQAAIPAPALVDLVALHLRRIAPTLAYAVGQDNNHGSSEAAALFVGGSWLQALAVPEAARWAAQGRRWLENRVARLVAADGSFSQHSLNYHRVLLDTCSMAEAWRRRCGLPPFSAAWQGRLRAATRWLQQMVDPISGDAPNLGANDGARLLPLSDTAYRDYRPSLQMAAALFAGCRAYAAAGPWDYPLTWLGLPAAEAPMAPVDSGLADDGGYAFLRRGRSLALLRYPRFRFRPGHADGLHLDFWRGGENLLRDDGSYSYHTEARWQRYFGATAGHNTVQFDDRDQMPRLGRFLFGDWLRTARRDSVAEVAGALVCAAGYRDGQGACHHRAVALADDHLRVTDTIAGLATRAVLRWRLAPGDWRQEGEQFSNGNFSLSVDASMPVLRRELVEGWESRHYLERTPLPVLEVEVAQPGTLITQLTWSR